MAVVATLLLLAIAAVAAALHRKQALVWLPSAASHGCRNWFIRRPTPVHVLFCFVDHFEPGRGQAPPEVAAARLGRWLDSFPELARAHRDSDGRPVCHTFFYPFDEWRDGESRALGTLCYDGLAEIELHLHHRDDDSANLRATSPPRWTPSASTVRCSAPAPPARGSGSSWNWCLDNARPAGLVRGQR